MQQVISIKQSFHKIETIKRKDGIVYLKRMFSRRNDVLFSTIDLINQPTIVISKGRSSDNLQKLQNNNLKTIIRIDSNHINGLEHWDEELGIFIYVAASAKGAISLAGHLAERGDAIFFAPLEYGKENLEMYLQFDQELESLLV